MAQAALPTAENVLGKAQTINGLVHWVHSAIEAARTNWRTLALLRFLLFLLRTFLRPWRQLGPAAVEPSGLRSAAERLRELSAELRRLLASASLSGDSVRLLFASSFRALERYQREVEALAAQVGRSAEEWEAVAERYGADVLVAARAGLRALRAEGDPPSVEAPEAEDCQLSMDPFLLRDHAGRIVSRH